MAILEHCRIGVDLKIDTAEMMKLTKGNRSPSEGFVILFPDEKYMTTDFFGLVQWIENNGLKPI
jgi:hypothetical protein